MYNKVILIGRLTSTPGTKPTCDRSVARATIAVNRRYKDQNGEREADLSILFFGKWLKQQRSYATKRSSLISVDGELCPSLWENGQMNYMTETQDSNF